MEIVTGSTGEAHVTPIDDAVRNSNIGYANEKVVFDFFENFAARGITANEVRIFSGYGMNQGRLFKINRNSYDSVTIRNGSQGFKRADIIVARYTFNQSTGFEDISLAVVEGTEGNSYVDPECTEGEINNGDITDDFPLYRVKLDGIVMDGEPEPLFTPLPLGGRIGELAALIAQKAPINHASTETTYGQGNATNYGHVKVTDVYNPTIGEGESAGSAANGIVASQKAVQDAYMALINAMQQAGYGDMMKSLYDPNEDGIIAVPQGGTGKSSIGSGKVLVGNGTGTPTERSIDTTSGGVENSTNLTTAGALYATKTALQTSFQAGVETIYDAIVAEGVTPSASTPQACATGIAKMESDVYDAIVAKGVTPAADTIPGCVAAIPNVYTKGKTDAEAVTWTELMQISDRSKTEISLTDVTKVEFLGFTYNPGGYSDLSARIYTEANLSTPNMTAIRSWTSVSSYLSISSFTSSEKYLYILTPSDTCIAQFRITRQAKTLR